MDSRDPRQRASDLHAHALVLDMTMPMLQRSELTRFWRALDRMRVSGYSCVSGPIGCGFSGRSGAEASPHWCYDRSIGTANYSRQE